MKNQLDRSRREFIKATSLGVGAVLAYPAWAASGGANPRLLVGVKAACRRLAGLGWRKMLLDATGGELDLMASDLAKDEQVRRAYLGE